ncbi:SMI1/KNR4 family protein [Streptomyces tendae]|uniref:SMI1/KNR4 family protein n=1 Tax=Streptomyces tendae TaxID=1932 RepID=UPI0037137344
MARDRRHHPRDRHAPHSLEPRLTSNVDRLDAPHRRSGARRPPDTRAGPSACINLEETAPRKHRAPVSTPTRTHEPSLACQDGAAEVEYPRMHVTQSDESERNLSQEVRIEHAWSRIVDWLRENFPNHHQAFNSGARTSLINAAEEEIGVAFPVELRTWMSMNNGSTAKDVLEGGFYQPHPDSVFLPGDSVFLDLRQIVDVYRDFLADGTEWRPGWIPFARQSDASYGYFLDVGTGSSPAPVMIFMEESPPKLAFPSLADFLEATANALEGGEGIRALGNRISYRPATDTGMVRWKRSENAF